MTSTFARVCSFFIFRCEMFICNLKVKYRQPALCASFYLWLSFFSVLLRGTRRNTRDFCLFKDGLRTFVILGNNIYQALLSDCFKLNSARKYLQSHLKTCISYWTICLQENSHLGSPIINGNLSRCSGIATFDLI